MKIRKTVIISAIICTAALVIYSSCTKVTGGAACCEAPEISFRNPETRTRAAADIADDMEDFRVWGWHTASGAEAARIFDATIIYKDAGWNYTDGTRYWVLGETYDFYALHPASISASYDPDGKLTVQDFDCSATGSLAVDLMTASNTGIRYNDGDEPQPVDLTFRHELARLKFTVKSEHTVANITAFKIYGINYKGTLNRDNGVSTWTDVQAYTEDNTGFSASSFSLNTTDGMERDVFGDILLLPHSDLTGAKLHVAYRYPEETADRTVEIDLGASAPSWLAGQSYSYTLTIKGGSLTLNVSVLEWQEEDTSVSWGGN